MLLHRIVVVLGSLCKQIVTLLDRVLITYVQLLAFLAKIDLLSEFLILILHLPQFALELADEF